MKLLGRNALSVLLASLVLAACGGGGDGGAPPVGSLTIPLSTVVANYVNQSYSGSADVAGTFTVSGQTVHVAGSATSSESTRPGIFEGTQALQKTTTITGSVTGNGMTAPLSDVSVAWFDSNYRPLGGTSTDGYCVTTSANPMPTAAHVGDTGQWYSSSCYTDSSRQTMVGTAVTTYALEPDTAETALLKVTVTMSASGITLPAIATWRVNAVGGMTRLQETTSFASGGDSFQFTVTYR